MKKFLVQSLKSSRKAGHANPSLRESPRESTISIVRESISHDNTVISISNKESIKAL